VTRYDSKHSSVHFGTDIDLLILDSLSLTMSRQLASMDHLILTGQGFWTLVPNYMSNA
jgi:hypothetical protein